MNPETIPLLPEPRGLVVLPVENNYHGVFQDAVAALKTLYRQDTDIGFPYKLLHERVTRATNEYVYFVNLNGNDFVIKYETSKISSIDTLNQEFYAKIVDAMTRMSSFQGFNKLAGYSIEDCVLILEVAKGEELSSLLKKGFSLTNRDISQLLHQAHDAFENGVELDIWNGLNVFWNKDIGFTHIDYTLRVRDKEYGWKYMVDRIKDLVKQSLVISNEEATAIVINVLRTTHIKDKDWDSVLEYCLEDM